MPVPENDYERSVLENVREHGWHFTYVHADESGPSFGYTVGLHETFAHPELLVFGLPQKLSHSIASTTARAAENGAPLNPNEPCAEHLDGSSTVFVRVAEAAYQEYMLTASWYYGDAAYPVLQVVWPSYPDGHFPWEQEASSDFRASQPVLGTPLLAV